MPPGTVPWLEGNNNCMGPWLPCAANQRDLGEMHPRCAAGGQRGRAGNQGGSRTRRFAIPTSPVCLELHFLGTTCGVITAVRSVHMRAGVHLIPSTVSCSRRHADPSTAFTSPRAVHGCTHSAGAREGSLLYTTQGAGLRSHNFGEESRCAAVSFFL